uniref:Thrombospondin type 1 domain containing 1 n=1 Tax=Leptobrachium leishanense TaxID=445787 RepID=A0A8C5P7B6_9ANUR
MPSLSNLLTTHIVNVILLTPPCLFTAFGEPGYVLLQKPHHFALSKESVYVDFYLPDNNTVTLINRSVSLWNTGNNQKVTSKELPANTTHGSLMFECSFFVESGLYQFQISFQTENNSHFHVRSSILNVTWPTFYIELNRTSKDSVRSFQIGVFTNRQLCSVFPDKEPVMLLEVEHIHNFQEPEEQSRDQFMLYKTYKEIPLSSSQWVDFECASQRPEMYITVFLKPMVIDSIMASLGPIDLVETFKYKMDTSLDGKCDSSLNIYITPPPCNYVEGNIVVYKHIPKGFPESAPSIAEFAMHRGDKVAKFNCSLFDIGRNKYCFELLMRSNHSLPKVDECVEIRREIETWSLWQSWSPCSTTCGDGHRERHRECLSTSPENPSCNGSPKEISICSLDDCSSRSIEIEFPQTFCYNNTVTIIGISLCLFIIFITIVITVWRKLSKAQTCSPTVRPSSSHSVNCRKNSDEESIYQLRESFSDTGEVLSEGIEDGVHIPLNCNQSSPITGDQAITENDSLQSNVQKIIPPIFSYRLAQQQLKEMRQKGLTEATKVYHVSQNPLADTALDIPLTMPPITDNSDEAASNKFRIQSPFLVPKNACSPGCDERSFSKSPFPASQRVSPSQTLPKLYHSKSQDAKARHYEKGYQKHNTFRRTSSFHDNKYIKPYRERSLTTLSPRHSMTYNAKTRAWEYPTVERSRHKSPRTDKSPDNITRDISLTKDASDYLTKNPLIRPGGSKPDLICSRQLSARTSNADRPEQNRARKGPSPVGASRNRVQQDLSSLPKEIYNRNSSLSPSQYRKEKCQSFPWGTEFSFYDNTTFRLTEAEQQMLDLPGYFASNEEDETSTLSMERLVI